MKKQSPKIAVIILSWNSLRNVGEELLIQCFESVMAQTTPARIVLVENGSTDGSAKFIEDFFNKKKYSITLLKNSKNRGFAGGVNTGIRFVLNHTDLEYIFLLNNDAYLDKDCLEKLVGCFDKSTRCGLATSKFLHFSEDRLDSTGDFYSTWGLPFPRGRNETDVDKYDKKTQIFGVSGGASMFKAQVFREIGLFDEDLFAYYEDIDISFRAQLAGWRACYVPEARAHHHISATGSKIRGFAAYHTFKNLPVVYLKNMPGVRFWKSILKFNAVYFLIFLSAIKNGNGSYAIKGCLRSFTLMPKKLSERIKIQRYKKVSTQYIDSVLYHGIPPTASKLRKVFPLAGHEDTN